MEKIYAFLLLGFFCLPAQATTESVQTPHVLAEIRSEFSAYDSNKENWIGIRLKVIKGWHIYWRNPGDSGLPTKVQWTLPEGWEVSDIYWPIPSRFKLLPLVNFGFEEDNILGFILKIPPGESGKKEILVKVSWLVCKESCIPEKVELSEIIDFSSKPKKNPWSISFDLLRAQQPQTGIITADLKNSESRFELSLSEKDSKWLEGKKIDFFPYEPQLLKTDDVQIVQEKSRTKLILEKSEPFNQDLKSFRGILVTTDSANGGIKKSYEIDLPIPAASLDASGGKANPIELKTAHMGADIFSLLISVVLAFFGGIILNLMPCVFPVLGIKVMSLINNNHTNSKKHHGEIYTLGVLCSFWALTAILLSARSAGQSIGWGFQLQQPGFVIAMILLFSVMTANLIGFFEFGGRWMGAGAALAAKDGIAGTFFTGILAVIVATPCTAPFMGAAIGAAITQPAWGVFLVFTSLGLGLAFPFLLFSYFPKLLKILPRPGKWMDYLKRFFALPMLFTVVWLFWVLKLQLGSSAVDRMLMALGVLALSLWVNKKSKSQGGKILTLVFFVSAISLAYSALQIKEPKSIPSPEHGWQSFSSEKLERAINASQPVFVDFTAAWCLSCQVNEKVVMEKETVKKFFRDNEVLLLRGDWTNNDPIITAELEKNGRIGVPLYLAYPKGSNTPKVLPQILSEKIIIDAFRVNSQKEER